MPFDDGRNEMTQELLSESMIEAFTYITDLGDPLFIVLVVSALYLFVDRYRGSFVIGVTFAGYGITVALKELLAIPRPPADVQVISASGYGVPSGHTLGAVIVFGMLAEELEIGTRSQRYVVASTLVGLVAASRIVLGVHYVADVIAGFVLGAGILAVVYGFDFRRPFPLFAIGAIGALVAMVLSGLTYASSLVLFGFAVGALVSWPLLTPLPEPSERTAGLVGVVALPVAVLLMPLGPALLVTPLTVIPFSALAIVLILSVPNVAAHAERTIGTPN